MDWFNNITWPLGARVYPAAVIHYLGVIGSVLPGAITAGTGNLLLQRRAGCKSPNEPLLLYYFV